MKPKYRIRGKGQCYWIQQRVLFWWSDVLQTNAQDKMYRKEYATLQEAYTAMLQFVALDNLQKHSNI